MPDIEDDSGMVNTILLWRLYDVMSLLLSNINPEDYELVMKAHEAGAFITPLPSYTVQEEPLPQ